MSNVELMNAKLNEMGFRLGGITLGDNPTSKEAVAGEILKSLEAIERGDVEVIADFDE